jgi:hypothetical protein
MAQTNLTAELQNAFALYFAEIDRCLNAKCYWSLVHLLIVLPAICAATETQSGEAGDYTNWCRRYFPKDPKFTDQDRYGIRVALVHQGRTTVDHRGQYGSYTFVGPTEPSVHLTVRNFGADGKNLTIDVGQLASDTKRAIEAWFTDEQNGRRTYIAPNLPMLARQGIAEMPGATGIAWTLPAMTSTGGLGQR